VIFKQYISKEHKHFGMKIYKLCKMTSYTHDMNVYLGEDTQNATQTMTATHRTVRSLTRRAEGAGYKLYMDNFFSSPDTTEELYKRGIHCCGTVRQNHKGIQGTLTRTH
jgi:hypothetical protein